MKASLADVISRLQRSYLPIQGPPGTGKTWGTAHAITQLARQGHKIGICGPSHKVIANLAEWIGRAADDQGFGAHQLRVFQRSDKADIARHDRVCEAGTTDTDIDATLTDPSVVVAGTSWLYANADYTKAFDIVFIDEAGQLSLADTLAVAQAANNVVLVGDPQQLTQPVKGTHPPHLAVSALEHILGTRNTIAPHAGILLAETRRLHPDLCGWTSDRFYDGRLAAHSTTHTQQIGGNGWLSGSGIRFLPVVHTGCRTRSRAEAEAVADICHQLIGRDLTDNKGQTRAVTPADIAVIAPYNAHCSELAATPSQRRHHRHRRPSTRARGPRGHLHARRLGPRRHPAGARLSVLPEPPQRRNVTSPSARRRRRQPRPPHATPSSDRNHAQREPPGKRCDHRGSG